MQYTADDLVSIRRLARELRLPIAWLKTEAQTGQIPCLHIGRKCVFNLTAVKRVLAERAAEVQPKFERTSV